ncbi:ATP-binding cassette domain-containing protein [Marispirochaeta aestuarii]|uniref:metal ABC transporter ATP-binding protein n=1 Tax=Marispirochaeta aestuarii TaxID=1963862 RepID=UPI0029C8F0AD|nr:ATP-binding cassette domain-containing protein [Marispirochaeta aestuarii]
MTDSLISFRAVNVRRGKRLVLRDLSFEIGAGEHLILQGENGIGKTTLLKTALGFILPEKGSLIRKLRGPGSLAYLPQESLSGDLPISVQEVVDIGFSARRMGRTERRRRIHDLLEALGCASLAGRSFATLSGGEKQRVSLARCLAQAPEMLILDEPTAGLDPEIRSRFYPLLLEMAAGHGAAVLLVTHDLKGIPEEGWRRLRLEQELDTTRVREVG